MKPVLFGAVLATLAYSIMNLILLKSGAVTPTDFPILVWGIFGAAVASLVMNWFLWMDS